MSIYNNKNLIAAFDLYVKQQDTLFPDEEALKSISFSDNFTARMKQMLSLRKRGYYVLFGTMARRVVSIVVVLLVSASITVASVEALRTPVVQFFTEVYEKFTQVFFVDNTSNEPAEAVFDTHAPAYIPKGYEICSEQILDTQYQVVYTNKNGDRIRFVQQLKDNSGITIDTEEVTYTQIQIGIYEGISYENKGRTGVVFMDEEYIYSLSSTIDESELIEIAESIVNT